MGFQVKKYRIKTNKFSSVKKISMVFLSDLHLTEHGLSNGDIIDSVSYLKPDVVLAGGDMIIGKENCATTIAENLLSTLAVKWPVICALGNHEQRLKIKKERFGDIYDRYLQRLKSFGIKMLDNESSKINIHGETIYLHGLNLPLSYFHRFSRERLSLAELEDFLGSVNDRYFNVLLAHHPRFAETYFQWGADLILSGHVHGGVMRLGKKAVISPDFQIFPKYGYGKFEKNDQNVLISSGLGEHTIPFRLFNPKELLYIEIIQEVSHGDSR